jgi:hypothetical protein
METIIPKLSAACFVVRSIQPFVTQDTLKMFYHSYFRSLINYGVIFWGNSSYSNSIFKLQKRIFIIIMGVGITDSCTEFFTILNILPWYHDIYFLLYSLWLLIKLNLGWILRYILSIQGIILISVNLVTFDYLSKRCHI